MLMSVVNMCVYRMHVCVRKRQYDSSKQWRERVAVKKKTGGADGVEFQGLFPESSVFTAHILT